MKEKMTSILLGMITGMIGSITIDRVVEVLIMSFLGGIAGALGHWLIKWIKRRINNAKNQ